MAGTLASGFRAMLAADLGRVLSKGLLILVLSRYLLTPAEYGLLFLTLAILGTVRLFSNFGLPKSTARYVTDRAVNSPGQVPHLLRFSFGVNAATITAVSVALFALNGYIADVLDEPALAPLLIIGVGHVVGRSLETHAITLFQAFNDVRWSAAVRTVSSVGQFVFAVVLVVAGMGVAGALTGFVAAGFAAAALGVGALYWLFYRDYDPDPEMESGLPVRVLRYSAPLTVTGAANLIDKRIDSLLVAYFLNPVAVAYYTLAKQISEFVMTPAASLGFTVAPQYGDHKANDDASQAATLYHSAYESIVSIYLPAAAGMVLVADPAVRFVFGADYLGAVPAVQVFGFYTLLLALMEITNDGLDYLGRAKARATAKIATSAANFGLNLVLIPRYGVVGAAVATIVTTSALVAVEMYVIVQELPVSPRRLATDAGGAALISAAMAAAVYAARPLVAGLPSLLVVVALGVAVWAALATASGMFDIRRAIATVTG